jgi:septal ring-binding cell division protein DamX
LEQSSGYQAGLEAYRSGDFSGAARLWRQQWIGARQGSFTLQVLMACEPGTLRRMRDQAPTSERLFLSPVQVNGRSCYKVLWGTYPGRAEAEAAVPSVPAFFTSGGDRPWPVPLSTLEPR